MMFDKTYVYYLFGQVDASINQSVDDYIIINSDSSVEIDKKLEDLLLLDSNHPLVSSIHQQVLTSKVNEELSKHFSEEVQTSPQSESKGFGKTVINKIRKYKKKSFEAVRGCLGKTKTKFQNVLQKVPKPIKGTVKNLQRVSLHFFPLRKSVEIIKYLLLYGGSFALSRQMLKKFGVKNPDHYSHLISTGVLLVSLTVFEGQYHLLIFGVFKKCFKYINKNFIKPLYIKLRTFLFGAGDSKGTGKKWPYWGELLRELAIIAAFLVMASTFTDSRGDDSITKFVETNDKNIEYKIFFLKDEEDQ
jgi:hypothetical protein